MSTFTPPVVLDDPPFGPDTNGIAWLAMRYMSPRARGVNVYALSDGSFCQDVATAENKNTNIPPWPLMPDQGKTPNIISRQIVSNDKPEVVTLIAVYVTKIYWGGHATPITAAEVTALTNYTAHGIGYGGNIH